MEIDSNGIAERVLEFRKSLGFTQKQLAEKADIGRSYIAHVESGSLPSSEFFMKLLKTFNVSIDWLLTGRGKMLLPEEEHVFNQLTNEHIKLLEKLTALDDAKQTKLINVYNEIIDLDSP